MMIVSAYMSNQMHSLYNVQTNLTNVDDKN